MKNLKKSMQKMQTLHLETQKLNFLGTNLHGLALGAKKNPTLLVRYSTGGLFCYYFFCWEDYVPELQEIGLEPVVQGVLVKKKRRV